MQRVVQQEHDPVDLDLGRHPHADVADADGADFALRRDRPTSLPQRGGDVDDAQAHQSAGHALVEPDLDRRSVLDEMLQR